LLNGWNVTKTRFEEFCLWAQSVHNPDLLLESTVSSSARKRREEEERKAREKAERARRERKCPECDKKVIKDRVWYPKCEKKVRRQSLVSRM
jgi:hypothetical protein